MGLISGYWNKLTGDTPSGMWSSWKNWFSGQTAADISSAAQIYTNAEFVKQQKKLDEWRALNLPSAQKQGYINAGINPILVGNTSPSVVSAHSGSVAANGGNVGSVLGGLGSLVSSAKEIATAKSDIQQAKEDVETTRLENNRRSIDNMALSSEALERKIDADARNEAMTGVRDSSISNLLHLHGIDQEPYDRLVEMYRNQIDSGAYKSSLGHAVYEDIMSSAKSAADAYTDYKAAKAKSAKPTVNSPRRQRRR